MIVRTRTSGQFVRDYISSTKMNGYLNIELDKRPSEMKKTRNHDYYFRVFRVWVLGDEWMVMCIF